MRCFFIISNTYIMKTTLKSRFEAEQPTVVLMVNDRADCNMNCAHCFLSYEGKRSPDDVLNLVNRFRTTHRVIIAGSEPLTNLGYLEAYRRAGQNYILTNGLLLYKDPAIFDLLQEYGIEEIQLSLHFGIQEDLHSVPERIIRHVVQQAKERGFRVQIAVTITPENYQDVEGMCDQVHEMGADRIRLIKYLKFGSAREEDRSQLTDGERIKFFESVDSARSKYTKDDLAIQIAGNFGPREGTKGEEMARCNEYCPAGERLFAIAPDGQVYGCPYLMEYPIGELTEDFQLQIKENLCNGKRNMCLTDLL